MLVPEACEAGSLTLPASLSTTVKFFLCGGPDSSTSRYWRATLLKRASSLTRHMGVFFSLLFATAAVGWSPGALSGPGGAHSPPGLGLNMLR
ncbi:unnamed protein product, partial [Ixodes persulcatus]